MNGSFQFSDVLEQLTRQAGYNTSQLARLSGLPQKTVDNWIKGRVNRPREQADLLKLAQVLRLNVTEATRLFTAARYPIMEFLFHAAPTKWEEADILTAWRQEINRFDQAPFQAPASLPYFVGRERELAFIKQALLSNKGIRMCSLHGMVGVGKTTLAVRTAYDLRPYFPDGVLWAQMDRSDTVTILKTFGHAYGLDCGETMDLYSYGRVVREHLAKKRVLIILDNAQHSDEIRPLLPSNGSSAVLITTRRQNLAMTSGIHRLALGGFSQAAGESLLLFECMFGKARTQNHAKILNQIVHLLGHLPLAVAIAAKRLAYEPGWTPTRFLEMLQPEARRLLILVYENQNVENILGESFNHLTSAHRQMMHTLSTLCSDGFDVEEVANINQQPIEDTAEQLRYLYDYSYLLYEGTSRYHLHPLVSAYLAVKSSFMTIV